jgi:hypothetical protein
VNSPELSGAGGASALTGGPPGDRNILVNAPGSEGGTTGAGTLSVKAAPLAFAEIGESEEMCGPVKMKLFKLMSQAPRP